MVQNTHLIANGTVPLPFNTWNPSGYYLKPQTSDQYAIGYFKNVRNNTIELSAEAFYKNMRSVTDFADYANLFFNEDLITEIRQGKSWSYGFELAAQKKSGAFTGFASYTWSKAERKIEGVNAGRTYYANYDRRNVINVAGTYDLNDKWSFGSSFTYSTGRPITLPEGRYEYIDYNVDLISERNGYRLPDYHRLDVSAILQPRANKNRRWKSEWVFSVYNVYNRKNPFSIYTRVRQNENEVILDPTAKEARLVYLFSILPSVTYNVRF